MIDTSLLNYHAPIASEHVLRTSEIPVRHLYFAQCGTSVEELNTDLQAQGLCLRTSGANQGQTICGAFSTGTHGRHQLWWYAGLHCRHACASWILEELLA